MAQGTIYVKTGVGATGQWTQINLESTVADVKGLTKKLEEFLKKEDILDSNSKIKVSQIPDSILAGMVYGGVAEYQEWSGYIYVHLTKAAQEILNTKETIIQLDDPSIMPSKHEGLFYIAQNSFILSNIPFMSGDWVVAVSNTINSSSTNGEWSKIDNTDAITSVNGRTGAIYTYLGAYSNSFQYNKGDIISYTTTVNNISQNILFMATESIKGVEPTLTSTQWRVFGVNWESRIQDVVNNYNSLSSNINNLPKFVCNTENDNTPTVTNYPAGSIWIQLANN